MTGLKVGFNIMGTVDFGLVPEEIIPQILQTLSFNLATVVSIENDPELTISLENCEADYETNDTWVEELYEPED